MSNVLDWLLEDENPAIKYRTLIEIMDKNPEDYQRGYEKIWEHKQIKKLLKQQDENGLWHTNSNYIGHILNLNNLTAFAEYGLKKDKRLDRYVEYALKHLHEWNTDKLDVSQCYTPIVLRDLIMFGYHDRDDVLHLISEFMKSQMPDGGFMCKRMLDKKPKRKSCYKAAVSGLLLYAECKRNNIPLINADNLVNYFLKRDVFYSTDKTHIFIDMHGVPKGFGPMKIGIPLLLSALSILGAGNAPELQNPWHMMDERKNENGRYRAEGAAMQPGVFGKDGQENKWSTFYALLAEKYRNLV